MLHPKHNPKAVAPHVKILAGNNDQLGGDGVAPCNRGQNAVLVCREILEHLELGLFQKGRHKARGQGLEQRENEATSMLSTMRMVYPLPH